MTGILPVKKDGSQSAISDFREYNAGDDIRRIDWKGYARNGKLNVKLFMEEKQAEINIFVDSSKSMEFGDKNEFAKMAAASVAYIAISNMDKVSIYSYNDKIVKRKNSIDNKNRYMEIIDFLDDIENESGTNHNEAISMRSGLNLKKGLSVIISDFFDENGYEEAIKALQYMKQDIILLQVLSREETEPEEMGSFSLKDSESGEEQNLVIDEDMIRRYKESLKKYNGRISEFCRKRGISYYSFSADTYIIKALNNIMR